MKYIHPDKIAALHEAFATGHSTRSIAAAVRVAEKTVRRYRNQYSLGICARCNAPLHAGSCIGQYAVVDATLREEVITCRINEDLSTEAIADKFNISVTVAYRVLTGHPRHTLNRRGINHWTNEENIFLDASWADASWPELMAVLFRHSPIAIQRQASLRRSKRPPNQQHRYVKLSTAAPMIGFSSEKRAELTTRFRTELNPPPKPAQSPPARRAPRAAIIPRRAATPASAAPPRPAPATHPVSPDRAAELAAQERFIAEHRITLLPGVGNPLIAAAPPLVFDPRKRVWTRRQNVKPGNRWTRG